MSNRINELKDQAARLQTNIDVITRAFGEVYVPSELTSALRAVEMSINTAQAREEAVEKCLEFGRTILSGAFLVEDEDGKFRHENSDALKTELPNRGIIRWTRHSQNDGVICEIRVTVCCNNGDDTKSITRTVFIIDHEEKSFKTTTRDGYLDAVNFIRKCLPDEVTNFRIAELSATFDAIKRSLNASGIQPA